MNEAEKQMNKKHGDRKKNHFFPHFFPSLFLEKKSFISIYPFTHSLSYIKGKKGGAKVRLCQAQYQTVGKQVLNCIP